LIKKDRDYVFQKADFSSFARHPSTTVKTLQIQQLYSITVITHLLLSGLWPVGYNDFDFFDQIFQTGAKCKMDGHIFKIHFRFFELFRPLLALN
jgi:hypothetical protein